MDPHYLEREQRTPLSPRPEISDVEHGVLHYDKATYCGHPRQGVFKHFGAGEIVVGHNHAPCAYAAPDDVRHDLGGYHSRAVALLQRSMDGGRTWPADDDVVIYDETISDDEKRAFLYQEGAPREQIDMFEPDSLFYFGRTYLPAQFGGTPVCFALRSADRGRTWERTPTVIEHPSGEPLRVIKDCHPVVRMPDGRTLLAAMTAAAPPSPAIYRSTDQGLTWRCISRAAVDRSERGRFTYVGLLPMPGGELHCYFLHIASDQQAVAGMYNAICMAVSRDGGETWSEPEPIVGQGAGCWGEPGTEGNFYRSPWAMRLRDGRILVLFARRRLAMGIGGVVSEDGGRTWSHEFVVRNDAVTRDLGYPVGCQLEDGRIFTAYYYTLPDGNGFGGTRHIASSTFVIK